MKPTALFGKKRDLTLKELAELKIAGPRVCRGAETAVPMGIYLHTSGYIPANIWTSLIHDKMSPTTGFFTGKLISAGSEDNF